MRLHVAVQKAFLLQPEEDFRPQFLAPMLPANELAQRLDQRRFTEVFSHTEHEVAGEGVSAFQHQLAQRHQRGPVQQELMQLTPAFIPLVS